MSIHASNHSKDPFFAFLLPLTSNLSQKLLKREAIFVESISKKACLKIIFLRDTDEKRIIRNL